MSWEFFELSTEKVQTILAHVILMALEEVKDEIVDLRIVRATQCVCIGCLERKSLRRQQMIFINVFKLLEVVFIVNIAFFFMLLLFILAICYFAHPVFIVLCIPAEDALVENSTFLVGELERVHARALKSMKSLLTVSALHCCSLGLASEATELFFVDEHLQGFADVDPFFSFYAEPRI